MKVIITEKGKFDGIFLCAFVDEGETRTLTFDLDNWKCARDHGLFGGKYIQIMYPERMELKFNFEYDVDEETGNKIYKTLVEHGWISPDNTKL